MMILNYKNQKVIKMYLNQIQTKQKRRYKSQEQESAMKNIERLYNTRNKNIILFDDYFTIAPEFKYKTFRGNGIEV